MFDVESVLAGMSLEEKITYVSGRGAWRLKAMPARGIPAIMLCDGPHGLRKELGGLDTGGLESIESRPTMEAVCFPAGCAAAASWDPDVTGAIGRALGREARASDVEVVLGPAVNIKRSPLCGRNFEYYSEDPYLTGKLAASYIRGMQSEGVGASLKHFAVNSQEYRRLSSSSNLSERALREIYLYNFEIAVKEGRPWTVMSSYNRINGTYASENRRLLSDILRYEWGFDGAVMSDWGAVNDRAAALAAGLDLEMPSSNGANDEVIREALEDGRLSEADLDEACRRLLTLVKRTSESDREDIVFDYEADHELACSLAARSMVLLKNETLIPEGGDESLLLDADPMPLLPLKEGLRVAMIGEMAKKPRFQGGGSSHVRTSHVADAWEAANKRGIWELSYAQGYRLSDDTSDEALYEEAAQTAAEADVAVVFIGLTPAYESEGRDRTHINLPDVHNELLRRVLERQPNTAVVLHNGSPVAMPWIDEVPAVLEAYIAGEGVGEAAVRILAGEVNPSGHLPESFPYCLEQSPCSRNYPGFLDEVYYEEDVYVGYRSYSTHRTPILFPFGHGLSYTEFSYSDLKLSSHVLRADQKIALEAEVRVANEGSRAGEALVQIYISPRQIEWALGRPVRELKGFEKVYLEAGESKTVTLRFDARSFACYSEEKSEWEVCPGTYAVELCRDAATPLLEAEVELKAYFEADFKVTRNTCIGDLEANPGLWECLLDFVSAFGDEKRESLEREFRLYRAGLPLRSLRGYGGRLTDRDLDMLLNRLNHK